MSVVIKKVETRKELRRFVRFPEKLYRDNPYYVPPLEFDQINPLDQKKGAAQEFCDSELYLAYKNGELVGRVAAIVNHKANKQWNHKEVRFGWIDFVDDREVSKALIDKVEEFGRKHGMDSIVGPLGFTDFDPEGMLVEGFDRLSTMALIYNHPYYNDHIRSLGFEKDADWVEYKIYLPEKLPEKYYRIVPLVEERANVRIRPLTRKIVKKEHYGEKLFNLINECYKNLYNFTVLPDKMASQYLDFYLSILDLKYVTVVENAEGEPVAFGVVMPTIVGALQKSRGKLFPFGWYYLLKSMFIKHEDGAEMFLIGVHPKYQNSGLNGLIFANTFKIFSENGIKWAETNAILEYNLKNALQWQEFEHECKKRRRSYKKQLIYNK